MIRDHVEHYLANAREVPAITKRPTRRTELRRIAVTMIIGIAIGIAVASYAQAAWLEHIEQDLGE